MWLVAVNACSGYKHCYWYRHCHYYFDGVRCVTPRSYTLKLINCWFYFSANWYPFVYSQ